MATGLPVGIPVVAGTIDAWAEALSAGVSRPGDVMLMYGTTMFLVEVLAARAVSPRLWGTAGVAPGTYNLAAGMATSGVITGWLRDLTGASFEELTREATAFGVLHNLEAMRAAGGAGERLVAVGGGTKGGLWTRIVSDVLQQPQLLPAQTVGAAYGDAMLAAGVSGEAWNPVASVVEPDPDAAEDYERLYHLYRDPYRSTAHIAHAL